MFQKPKSRESQTILIKKRQQIFLFKAFGLFVVFSLLIAPLEYHFEWYHSLAAMKYSTWLGALINPLPSAVLYFYAIIIAFEALLFLAIYPEISSCSWKMKLVQILLWVPVVVFVLEYFVSPHYSRPGEAIPTNIPIQAAALQCLTAVAALILSLIVHTVSFYFEAKRQH